MNLIETKQLALEQNEMIDENEVPKLNENKLWSFKGAEYSYDGIDIRKISGDNPKNYTPKDILILIQDQTVQMIRENEIEKFRYFYNVEVPELTSLSSEEVTNRRNVFIAELERLEATKRIIRAKIKADEDELDRREEVADEDKKKEIRKYRVESLKKEKEKTSKPKAKVPSKNKLVIQLYEMIGDVDKVFDMVKAAGFSRNEVESIIKESI